MEVVFAMIKASFQHTFCLSDYLSTQDWVCFFLKTVFVIWLKIILPINRKKRFSNVSMWSILTNKTLYKTMSVFSGLVSVIFKCSIRSSSKHKTWKKCCDWFRIPSVKIKNSMAVLFKSTRQIVEIWIKIILAKNFCSIFYPYLSK